MLFRSDLTETVATITEWTTIVETQTESFEVTEIVTETVTETETSCELLGIPAACW